MSSACRTILLSPDTDKVTPLSRLAALLFVSLPFTGAAVCHAEPVLWVQSSQVEAPPACTTPGYPSLLVPTSLNLVQGIDLPHAVIYGNSPGTGATMFKSGFSSLTPPQRAISTAGASLAAFAFLRPEHFPIPSWNLYPPSP